MQVNNLGDWFDRSLSYLCRSFDQLYHGEYYASTKSVLHIGILDFNIFPEFPEFYSSYKLINVKNHQIYNDKFELRVLQLNRTELATKKDRISGLAHWASLFKAVTWEELKMLTQEKPVFDKIAQTLYKSNADEQIRYACQVREEYEFQMKRRQEQLDEYKSQMKRGQEQLNEYEFQMKRRQEQLDEYESQMKYKQEQLNEYKFQMKRRQEQLDKYESQIKRKQEQFDELQDENNRLRLELERLKGGAKTNTPELSPS